MATNSGLILEMDPLLERDSLERELEMELEKELWKIEHEEQNEEKFERDSLERELEMELERELEEMEREKMDHEKQSEEKLEANGETSQKDLKIFPNDTAVLQQDAAQRVAGLPRPASCPRACPSGDSICMTVVYESARIYCDHKARSIKHYCGKTPNRMCRLRFATVRNGPPRKLIADDALVDTGCHSCEKEEKRREQRRQRKIHPATAKVRANALELRRLSEQSVLFSESASRHGSYVCPVPEEEE